MELKNLLRKIITATIIFSNIIIFNSCKKSEAETSCDSLIPNLFSIEKDVTLGAQVAAQIATDPVNYPVLDSASNSSAYQYLYAMRDKILASGKVQHKDDFKWKLKIIKDANTLNAFCTPGGYIYVYTGLIKYLDNADDLAGVMGHEMAHADRRHSTKSMTRDYGVNTLLQIVLGNDSSALVALATNLTSLKYSRCHESEADEWSVIFLGPTTYRCDGAASFFSKLIEGGQAGSTPQFLSTHPNPDNRVAAITGFAASKTCNNKTTFTDNSGYTNFKNSLPN